MHHATFKWLLNIIQSSCGKVCINVLSVSKRSFEDKYIHYNSADIVSGWWAGPQHYRHFFPQISTDSQRLFMSLWPLCRQGGRLGKAARELQRRLCSVRLSVRSLTPSMWQLLLVCHLLFHVIYFTVKKRFLVTHHLYERQQLQMLPI